jgi:hypothetical protein
VSDWYAAPLVVKEGSPRGEGTIGLTKPQCRINPEKRPLPLPLPEVNMVTLDLTGWSVCYAIEFGFLDMIVWSEPRGELIG